MSARRFFSFLSDLDPITIAWFGGMSNPVPFEVKKIINDNLIKPCKSIIAKANCFYFPVINSTNDSFRNIAKNDHHGTIEGTGLTFDPFWGWYNPNGTGYVDAHFNPSTQGAGRYTLNDAGIAVGLFNANSSIGKFVLGIYSGGYLVYLYNCRAAGINTRPGNYWNFQGAKDPPFRDGLTSINRTSSTNVNNQNQNIPTYTTSNTSEGLPTANLRLFDRGLVGSETYRGGINFLYVGPSITESEHTTLNNAVNDTLIQLLFYRYGSDNWGVKMAKSYFLDKHNFEKYEAFEVYEFIKQMQPDYADGSTTGYYYNTFGPGGQNKTIADFIMLFKAGGNPSANPWVKTGSTLRWNQDGIITSSNIMPSYTRGSNLGIITVTSTDGWNGLSVIYQVQSLQSVNSFYGNCPMFFKLKTSGKVYLVNYRNRYKQDYRGIQLSDKLTGFDGENIDYPGYIKINTDSLIGGNYTGYTFLNKMASSPNTMLSGNLSLLTNEINCNTFRLASSTDLIGGLTNMVTSNSVFYLDFSNTGITAGLNNWNKYIGTFNLYNCNLNTAAVDYQLWTINNYFSGITPIKNVSINLSGVRMGTPSELGVSYKNAIIADHAGHGLTAIISTN